jgi:hypothetical protein
MPTANEYRELADKCFLSAREALTEDERMMYLTLAQTCWRKHRVVTTPRQFAYHRRPDFRAASTGAAEPVDCVHITPNI